MTKKKIENHLIENTLKSCKFSQVFGMCKYLNCRVSSDKDVMVREIYDAMNIPYPQDQPLDTKKQRLLQYQSQGDNLEQRLQIVQNAIQTITRDRLSNINDFSSEVHGLQTKESMIDQEDDIIEFTKRCNKVVDLINKYRSEATDLCFVENELTSKRCQTLSCPVCMRDDVSLNYLCLTNCGHIICETCCQSLQRKACPSCNQPYIRACKMYI